MLAAIYFYYQSLIITDKVNDVISNLSLAPKFIAEIFCSQDIPEMFFGVCQGVAKFAGDYGLFHVTPSPLPNPPHQGEGNKSLLVRLRASFLHLFADFGFRLLIFSRHFSFS